MNKLEVKAIIGHVVGYPMDSMGYEFYLPEDKRIVFIYHARFLEEEFNWESSAGRMVVLKEVKHEE